MVANVTIPSGVVIGENAVVGAGSVVTKSMPVHTFLRETKLELLRLLLVKRDSKNLIIFIVITTLLFK